MMPDPHEPTRPPAAPQRVEYATPARAGGPRRAPVAAWLGAAAITFTACAVTFGIVYWAMGRIRAARPPVVISVPLSSQPAFPQLSPGPGPAQPAPLAPGRADVAKCAMRLQRIAAALQAWANRHDWRLPDRLEDLVTAGLLERGDLVCPAGEANGATGTEDPAYRYAGMGLRTPVPSDVVVVYEAPLHIGGLGTNVLLGDGGVRLLTGEDASRLTAQVSAAAWPLRCPAPTTGSQSSTATPPSEQRQGTK